MKRKMVLSGFLAAVMLLSLFIPVFGADEGQVEDTASSVSDFEVTSLYVVANTINIEGRTPLSNTNVSAYCCSCYNNIILQSTQAISDDNGYFSMELELDPTAYETGEMLVYVSGENLDELAFSVLMYSQIDFDMCIQSFISISSYEDFKIFLTNYNGLLGITEGYLENEVEIMYSLYCENEYEPTNIHDVIQIANKLVDGKNRITEYIDKVNSSCSIMELKEHLETYNAELAVTTSAYIKLYDAITYEANDIAEIDKVYAMLKNGLPCTSFGEIHNKFITACEIQRHQEQSGSISGGGSFGGGGAVTIAVGSITKRAGNTIDIPIKLSDNTGFSSLGIEIDYDETVMTLVAVSENPEAGENFMTAEELSKKPFNMSWNCISDCTFNGELATLTFELKEGAASGDYPITIDFYKGANGNYINGEDVNYDASFTPLYIEYKNGTITIINHNPGDINDDGRCNDKDAILLLRYLAGWNISGIVEEALDVNSDGETDSNDSMLLLRYLAGWNVEIY